MRFGLTVLIVWCAVSLLGNAVHRLLGGETAFEVIERSIREPEGSSGD